MTVAVAGAGISGVETVRRAGTRDAEGSIVTRTEPVRYLCLFAEWTGTIVHGRTRESWTKIGSDTQRMWSDSALQP